MAYHNEREVKRHMLEEYRFDKIYIRHAIDEAPDDNDFTMHIHEQCEIYFFISGDVDYMVEGSKYPLTENSLMIIRPSEVHTPRIVGSACYERYAINFPIELITPLDPKARLLQAFMERPLGKGNLFDSQSIDTRLIRSLCDQMFSQYPDNYDRELRIKMYILTLLDLISRAFETREHVETKPLSTAERIVAYVNNHLFEPLTIPDLAGHFYLSTAQFNRVFRQVTGASPWEYITKKRLTAANEKIHSGLLAREAAESCGFSDYSSFYRAYTKYYGKSPSKRHFN